MSQPEFVKCPGCGQENLEDPGETAVHEKGCPFVGGVPAIETPAPEKPEKPPVFLLVLMGLIVATIIFCLGAMYGEEEGRKKGIEEYSIYKDLNSACMDRASTMTSAWVDQLKLTNECLHVLSKEAADANNRAVRAAEALGMPHNAVAQ